jgi:hypothetical protein
MKATRSKSVSQPLGLSVKRVRAKSRVLGPIAPISKLDSSRKRQQRQLTMRQALQPLPVRYQEDLIVVFGMLY